MGAAGAALAAPLKGPRAPVPARLLATSRARPAGPELPGSCQGLGSGCRSSTEDPAASASSPPGARGTDGHAPASAGAPGPVLGRAGAGRGRLGEVGTSGGFITQAGVLPRHDEPLGPHLHAAGEAPGRSACGTRGAVFMVREEGGVLSLEPGCLSNPLSFCLCWQAAGAQHAGDLHPPRPAVSSQLWARKEWQLVGYIKAGEPQPAQKKLLELLVFSLPPSLHVIQLPHARGAEDKPRCK